MGLKLALSSLWLTHYLAPPTSRVMNITRHFVRAGGREVHYRRAGSGPPFVLFHVSPQSSAFVLPHLLPLADRYTLIGLDTPGYGESDPLRTPIYPL